MLFGVRRVREDWGHIDVRRESWEGVKRKELSSENNLREMRENVCLCLTVCQKSTFLTSNGAFVKKFQSFDLKVGTH